ncbi:MAG: glycosyltransferase family 2 protein [Clostridiaceae bacterium]|nr:glycosyltransferase family 2 protein [Clostridiaceae bacterium]
MNKRVLLIIPAYNEAANIVGLVHEIQAKAPQVDYLIVNDGSTDNTKSVCENNQINAVHLPCNLGIGGAVQTGYLYAYRRQYDIAVQLDGDGQHDPAYISELIQPIIDQKADFVIGSRFIEGCGFQSSNFRRLGIRWLNGILKRITGLNITDATSGFRAGNRSVMSIFSDYYPKDYPEPESIADLYRYHQKIVEIPVIMRERKSGVSSIRLLKPIYYMIKVTFAILISRLKKHTIKEDIQR